MIKHEERLNGVDSQLAQTVRAAASLLAFDLLVVEGLRTAQRQEELYAQGRTKPGKIVTWTKASKHIGGRAVDIAPLKEDGSVDWENLQAFDKIADAMLLASAQVGVRLRYGGDWDGDGNRREKGEGDSPHWELL